jgi:hypothetical protein
MGPLGEELAPFAMPDQFLGISDCGWPVKTCSESFFDQCSRGGVVAIGPSMYVI